MNVDLVLPYVLKTGEQEVREAYHQVIEVRRDSPVARALADRHFFETVVRIHRAGEGAPYTGLKPAGLDVGPVIPMAEHAIETGVPDELIDLLARLVRHEVRRRFEHAMELKHHADENMDAARAYVQAMLGFQVYVHSLYQSLHAAPHEAHHEHGPPGLS
jgi:hypothetical protein